MKRAAIISKHGKSELGNVVRDVVAWLAEHGYSIVADAVTREFCPQCDAGEREELGDKKPDFVIVLGGDGTLLSVARNVARAGIPILGVNLGSLGFLTEIKQEEIIAALEALHAGGCGINERALGHCQLRRDGEGLARYEAFYDVVVEQ